MDVKKKLVELLRYVGDNIMDFRTENFMESLASFLIDNGVMLQEWIPVTMPQWIPVTERLPIEEYEEYKEKWQDDEYPGFLVMIEGALLPTHLYFDGEKWYETFGGGKYDHQVTHWMNLPAPPAKD